MQPGPGPARSRSLSLLVVRQSLAAQVAMAAPLLHKGFEKQIRQEIQKEEKEPKKQAMSEVAWQARMRRRRQRIEALAEGECYTSDSDFGPHVDGDSLLQQDIEATLSAALAPEKDSLVVGGEGVGSSSECCQQQKRSKSEVEGGRSQPDVA